MSSSKLLQIKLIMFVICVPNIAQSMASKELSEPQENKKILLQKLEDLHDDYFKRSKYMGFAPCWRPLPGEPDDFLYLVEYAIKNNREKEIYDLLLKISGKDECNELLEVLLDAGYSPNYEVTTGYSDEPRLTLLGQAIKYGSSNLKNAQLLLKRGASPIIPFKIKSSLKSKPESVFLLLRHGARLKDIWEKEQPYTYYGGFP